MLPIAIPTLIKDAPWILCGVLALVCAVFFGLWKAEEAKYANYKAAQAAAVIAAQERADKLANELVIEQAKNMAVTERTVVQYVDRIRNASADPERLRAIACGLWSIAGSRGAPSPCGSPDALPAPNAVRKP